MDRENDSRIIRIFYWLLIAVTTAGAVGWMLDTYVYADDLPYSHECVQGDNDTFWFCQNAPIEHWSQVGSSIVNHYNTCNGRISNLVMFPLAMFPRAVSEVLCGLLVGVMFWLLLCVGRLRHDHVSLRWLALAVALLWLAFPWYDNFQSIAFQLNYVLPAVMMLSAILLLRGGSRLAWIPALMTGWCHEGFGTVLISLLLFMWIARPDRRRIILSAGIAAVLGLALAMSPGTILRIRESGSAIGLSAMPLWRILVRMCSQAWAVWIAALLLIIYMWRRRGASGSDRVLRAVLPLAGATAVALLQAAVLRGVGRMLFPAIVCAVAASLVLVSELVGRGRPGRPAVITASLATAFYIVWLGGVIHVAHGISSQQREFHRIAAMSGSDTTSTIYADLDLYGIPYWTIGLTTNFYYYDYNPNRAFSFKYHVGKGRVVIMPREFAGMKYDEWPLIPGNAALRGKWPCVAGDAPRGEMTESQRGRRYDTEFLITLGEPTPSCTPLERLALAVRRSAGSDADRVVVGAHGYPAVVDSTERVSYDFEWMPRGYANRAVLRIDTVGCR